MTEAPVDRTQSADRKTFSSVVAPVSALLLSVALLLMGNGLQSTLIPVRASLENFHGYQVGLVGAFYFIGFTVGCFIGPALISRSGHIRCYLAMVSSASLVALVHALILDPIAWWALRAITGFCFAVLYIVIESWLNEQSTNDTRGTIFAIYSVINLTVISIGQMMLSLDDPKAFALFSFASILISLAAIPVAFTTATSPKPIPIIWPKLNRLYLISPVGFIGCFAVGLANGSFWSLGSVFAQGKGFDTFSIGLFMSAVVLGGAIAQWPLGWISDRVDRRRVILLAAVISATAAILLSAYPNANKQVTLIFATGFGMGAFPIYTLSVAHANDHTEKTNFVSTSSGLLLVFGIGASIGPIAAGVLQHSNKWPTLFIFTCLVHLLLILFILWRIRQRQALAEEHNIVFADALIAAETTLPYAPTSFDPTSTEHGPSKSSNSTE